MKSKPILIGVIVLIVVSIISLEKFTPIRYRLDSAYCQVDSDCWRTYDYLEDGIRHCSCLQVPNCYNKFYTLEGECGVPCEVGADTSYDCRCVNNKCSPVKSPPFPIKNPRLIECSHGSVGLFNLHYCNGFLSGNVENTGGIDLDKVYLEVFNESNANITVPLCRGGEECYDANLLLRQRENYQFNISIDMGRPEKVRVSSSSCLVVWDELKSSYITFC